MNLDFLRLELWHSLCPLQVRPLLPPAHAELLPMARNNQEGKGARGVVAPAPQPDGSTVLTC